MLVRDPSRRCTAKELLEHEWMREENSVARSDPLESEVLNRIRGFAAKNMFQKQALKVIAGNLPTEEIRGAYTEQFGSSCILPAKH